VTEELFSAIVKQEPLEDTSMAEPLPHTPTKDEQAFKLEPVTPLSSQDENVEYQMLQLPEVSAGRAHSPQPGKQQNEKEHVYQNLNDLFPGS